MAVRKNGKFGGALSLVGSSSYDSTLHPKGHPAGRLPWSPETWKKNLNLTPHRRRPFRRRPTRSFRPSTSSLTSSAPEEASRTWREAQWLGQREMSEQRSRSRDVFEIGPSIFLLRQAFSSFPPVPAIDRSYRTLRSLKWTLFHEALAHLGAEFAYLNLSWFRPSHYRWLNIGNNAHEWERG